MPGCGSNLVFFLLWKPRVSYEARQMMRAVWISGYAIICCPLRICDVVPCFNACRNPLFSRMAGSLSHPITLQGKLFTGLGPSGDATSLPGHSHSGDVSIAKRRHAPPSYERVRKGTAGLWHWRSQRARCSSHRILAARLSPSQT
jgi:hypothetical protein